MFAASSKFKLIQENYRAYVQLKIPNGPQQAKVLNQKVDMLGKLTDEYTKLIRMDSAPQVLAALNYTARANEHFVDAILAVPLPSGLSEEESKQYRAGIENVVAPKRTAAIDLFKKTIEKSQELDTYTQDSLDAYNSLSKYFPQDYIKWQDFMISEAKLDLGAL